MSHLVEPKSDCSPQGLSEEIQRLLTIERRRHERLWMYYRNPMRPCLVDDHALSSRPYQQGQEWGLPPRLTGTRCTEESEAGASINGIARKEIVIENDIAWRIDTMVELF